MNCQHCGQVIRKPSRPHGKIAKFCSNDCYWTHRGRKLTRTCQRCGAEFLVKPREVRRGHGNFCSKSCAQSGSGNATYTHGRYIGSTEGYPEARRAKTAVLLALRRGTLRKAACEICGSTKAEAHHDDYSRQLEIRWLCHGHHMEHHAKARRGEA